VKALWRTWIIVLSHLEAVPGIPYYECCSSL
jgi:hypothetical protein